jgi:hypothetical protein
MNRSWLPGPGTFNERTNGAGPDEVTPWEATPVDRGGRRYIASAYGDAGDVEFPRPGVFGERDQAENGVGYIARDEYDGQLLMGYPNAPLGAYSASGEFDGEADEFEFGDYEIGEVGDAPAAGLTTLVGPFPAWVWFVGVGTVAAFWLLANPSRR